MTIYQIFKNKNITVVLCLFAIFNSSFGQNVDSLIKIYKSSSKAPKDKMEIFYQIKWALYNGKIEEGYAILDETIKLGDNIGDKKAIAMAYEGKALLELRDGKVQLAEASLLKAISFAEQIKVPRTKYMLYIRMAELQGSKGKFELQHTWLLKVLNDKQSNNFLDIRGTVYSSIGIMHFYKAEHQKSIPYFIKSTKIFKDLKDMLNLAYDQENMGRAYSNLGKNDSALYWYHQSYQNYQISKSKSYYGSITYNLALAYYNNAQHDSAISYFILANKYFTASGDQPGIGMALEGIGMIYKESGYYEKALNYYLEAEKVLNQTETKYALTELYQSIGDIYKANKQPTKAATYYSKMLDLATSKNEMVDMATASNACAMIYLELGELIKTKNYLDLTRKYVSQTDNGNILSTMLLSFAEYHHKTNNYQVSILTLDSLLQRNLLPPTRLLALSLQSNNFAAIKDYKKAFEYGRMASDYKDSIAKLSNIKIEKEVLAKYAVEKAENQTALINSKMEQERQKKWFGYALALLGFIALLVIIWRNKKYTNEKVKTSLLKLEAAENDVKHAQEILRNQSNLIIEKNRIISEFKMAFDDQIKNNPNTQQSLDHFLENNILTKEDWASFETKFNIIYPDFKSKVYEQFQQITSAEYRMLCLMKLGLNNEEMGKTLGVLPRSMDRTFNRFKTKYNIDHLDLNNY
jgi:tetratricopeptide (TPR) repeat protein